LTGGGGADLFKFVSTGDFGTGGLRDLITDFSRTQGDRIDLSAIDTNGVLEGDQAFLFVGTSAFSGVAGELRYALNAGVFSVSGDLDGDQIADFTFDVTGRGLTTLQAADFVL
jgi:Ca2+-binding RTX toxin-like protein